MKNLVFATGNRHKADEMESILEGFFEIKTMRELGFMDDIPEDEPDLEGNARAKARHLKKALGMDCFSEDTGLEVEALGGRPGVDTAHYSGSRDADENIALLLKNMEKLDRPEARRARFRTCICLIFEGKELLFEGICPGWIAFEKAGPKGFGYDPVFIPDGSSQTFAELGIEVKNRISHRAIAAEKMKAFLLDHSA